MSWQGDLKASAAEFLERERRRGLWVIHCTSSPFETVPQFSRVWATRTMQGQGGQDLDLMATCYERHVVTSLQNCPDGIHMLAEFLPPIESIAVRPERMTSVVNALMASGYHARCSDGHGKSYEF